MRYLLSDIATICSGRLTGPDGQIDRVITDSRSLDAGAGVVEGVLFVAIRGERRDGAGFVDELYRRGVRNFLVNSDFVDAARYDGAGFVLVSDTLQALQTLAAHHRATFTGKVVGITGSHGKTIVKEWISQLTPEGVTLFRSPKSWNSQLGVPLSILMARGDEEYVLIEAGISKRGEMAALERIVRPDIGILTSLGTEHLENFDSPEQLEAEKMLLFAGTSPVLRGAQEGEFATRNTELAVRFWNSQGYEITKEALERLEPVAMRLELKEGMWDSLLVNDTYNSDINSLRIALDYLARVAGGKPRVVIMPQNPEAAAIVRASGAENCIEIGSEVSLDDFLRTLKPTQLAGRAILIRGGKGFQRLSNALERQTHTTLLEVDLDAILNNLHLCRARLTPGVGVMPMIKADAYGHGSLEVARVLEAQGVDYLAVAFADEGIALREAGIIAPIVVMNADEGSFQAMIRHRLEPEIYNFVSLNEFCTMLKRHGEHRYPIHLKLDTGMHRLGFLWGERERLTGELAAVERWARVATIFSHLAAADDPAEDDFTRRQIADFDRFSSDVTATLPYPVRRHTANSAAIERFPEAQFDLVRPGLGLYGFGFEGARQAATLKTRIVNVFEAKADQTIGYGRRGKLDRDSVIATIPIGYADGLNRRLSCGKWNVLVGNDSSTSDGTLRPAPIVGNVCMDSCMIDVTGIPNVKEGSRAVIFSPAAGNTIADMAAALGTIPYEVMTSLSGRIKRIYTKE